MKIFGEVNVLRGTVAWSRPFRLRLPQPAPPLALPAESAAEYDEDGRLYAFRYPRAVQQQYSIERDRIFEYMKRRRLPDAGQRQIRRDVRNSADFIADVRDLQCHAEIEAQE